VTSAFGGWRSKFYPGTGSSSSIETRASSDGQSESYSHRNLGEAENTAQYATQLTTIRFLSVSPLKRSKLPPGLPISRSY
jgi:hypothetical protein